MTRHPLRLPAFVLLCYPAQKLAGNVYYALEWDDAHTLTDGLLLMVLPAVIAVGLMRRKAWAYLAALVFSGAIAAVMLTVYASVLLIDGDAPWHGDTPFSFAYSITGPTAAAAAFTLLLRARHACPEPRLRSLARSTAVVFGVESVLMVLIAIFGFGAWEAEWYQEALGFTQVPGTVLLAHMGLCCGYYNGLVITDVWGPHWGGLRMAGIPILMVANTAGLLVLARLLQAGWLRARHRRAGAIHPAASA